MWKFNPFSQHNKCLHVFFYLYTNIHNAMSFDLLCILFIFRFRTVRLNILLLVHSILSFLPSECGHFTWTKHNHQSNNIQSNVIASHCVRMSQSMTFIRAFLECERAGCFVCLLVLQLKVMLGLENSKLCWLIFSRIRSFYSIFGIK